MRPVRSASAVVVLAGLCTFAVPLKASGSSSGITGGACNNCHMGGVTPAISVSPPPSDVPGGQTVTFTVTVSTPNGAYAGFNLFGTAGTFGNPGPNVKVVSNQATHTAPTLEDITEFVSFSVDWTAPMTSGPVTLTAWGNSVDLSGDPSGDLAASMALTFNICAGTAWYLDADADGYGAGNAVVACTMPQGHVSVDGDCDDSNASVHPGATETCNGIDDDCDAAIDDGIVTPTWFADADGDAFGDPNVSVTACNAPAGHVAASGDCDDQNASIHPGAMEVCNGVDDDCDAQVDEGLPQPTFYADLDGDGVGGVMSVVNCAAPMGYVLITGDCDDQDPTVRPGLPESCNGKDEDCDSQVDEAVKTTFFRDQDGDLFGAPGDATSACALPPGYVANDQDCDDQNGAIHPGAAETCDSVDENCDGQADDGVPMATCGLGACRRSGTTCYAQSCTPGMGNPETCNGVDDDCNGIADDDPDALCDGTQTCVAGACAEVPQDAGADDGTDGGVDAGMDGGTVITDPPEQGCGCGASNGNGMGVWLCAAVLTMSGALRTRRRFARRRMGTAG